MPKIPVPGVEPSLIAHVTKHTAYLALIFHLSKYSSYAVDKNYRAVNAIRFWMPILQATRESTISPPLLSIVDPTGRLAEEHSDSPFLAKRRFSKVWDHTPVGKYDMFATTTASQSGNAATV
jgi:hypothetical protein